MKVGIRLNINVSKLEKARIHQGNKGQYIDLTTFVDIDQKDQYDNNGFISQDVTKEEREQGVKGPIVGNCKVFFTDSGQQRAPQQNQGQQQAPREYPTQSQPKPGQTNQPTQQAQSGQGFEDFDDIPF